MRKLILSLVVFLALAGCKKLTADNSPAANGWFEIEIKATSNIDCNLPEIIFNTGQKEAYSIIGDSRGVYIGLGLPKVMYPAGKKLLVHIRKPNSTETIPCTSLGIGWAHVFVTEVQ